MRRQTTAFMNTMPIFSKKVNPPAALFKRPAIKSPGFHGRLAGTSKIIRLPTYLP
jgi:hypothetical protein